MGGLDSEHHQLEEQVQHTRHYSPLRGMTIDGAVFDAFFDFNVYPVLPEVWGSDSAFQGLGCPGRQWRRKPAR